jgi:hypothetical protein
VTVDSLSCGSSSPLILTATSHCQWSLPLSTIPSDKAADTGLRRVARWKLAVIAPNRTAPSDRKGYPPGTVVTGLPSLCVEPAASSQNDFCEQSQAPSTDVRFRIDGIASSYNPLRHTPIPCTSLLRTADLYKPRNQRTVWWRERGGVNIRSSCTSIASPSSNSNDSGVSSSWTLRPS